MLGTREEANNYLGERLEENSLLPHMESLGWTPFSKTDCPLPKGLFRDSGFTIPYHTVDGSRLTFYRVRFVKRKGDPKSKPKYSQPPDEPHLYIPPLPIKVFRPLLDSKLAANYAEPLPWSKIAQDVNIPIIITEGEIKAAAACAAGFPTLAIGGVWCWGAKTRRIELLDAFKDFKWEGRKVYICFDSDGHTNDDIQLACQELINTFLRHLLGDLYIAHMPDIFPPKPDKTRDKTGLDDFLIERGVMALAEHLADAMTVPVARELHRLNQEFCLVDNLDKVYRFSDGHLMGRSDFVALQHAAKKHIQLDPLTRKKKLVSTAATWLEWTFMRRCPRLTYMPGAEPVLKDGAINEWKNERVMPVEGDVAWFLEFMNYLFDIDPNAEIPDLDRVATMGFVMDWMALVYAYPGTKMRTAPVLIGPPGVGKGFLGHILAFLLGARLDTDLDPDTQSICYPEGVASITSSELESSFNDWCYKKELVIANEVLETDRKLLANLLKNLVTEPKINVNTKHIKRFETRNTVNMIFTSNYHNALRLDNKDRRYCVVMTNTDVADDSQFVKLWARLFDPKAMSAVAHWMIKRAKAAKARGFHSGTKPPRTRFKLWLESASRSDCGDWLAEVAESPELLMECGRFSSPPRLVRIADLYFAYKMGVGAEDKRVTDPRHLKTPLHRAGWRQPYTAPKVTIRFGASVLRDQLWVVNPNDTDILSRKAKPQLLVDIYRSALSKTGEAALEKLAAKITPLVPREEQA
jgi:hypothetical protein